MENLTNKKLSSVKDFWQDDKRIYFFRQVLIASGSCSIYFSIGMMLGAPTVFIPQLRRSNVTVTDTMASWLSSTFSYAAIPWILIITTLARVFGRKKICIFISLSTITNFIVFYFSKTITHLIITEIMFGVTQAAVVSISIIIISEYTSAKYRGVFLCIKSASFLWGIWVSNAIGIFVFWGFIPVVGFIVSLWSLTVCFWPESPHWLAGKNRFAECRNSHRWLKGTGEAAELELEKIIESQIEPENIFRSVKDLKFVTCGEFFKPLLLSMLAVLQYQFSGKFVITIYAIDILKKIVKNDSNVYSGMLILDGVTVLGAYVGSFMAKLYKRRTILLSTSIAAISFLIILSLYLYLVSISVCSENVYLSISLLAGFSVSISCGPIIINTSLYGELVPSRYKSISIVIIGLEFVFLHGTFLKLGPMIIRALGLPGTFLFYASCAGFCTFLLYLYLPETKDRTLIEIEEYFKEKKNLNEGRKLVT